MDQVHGMDIRCHKSNKVFIGGVNNIQFESALLDGGAI